VFTFQTHVRSYYLAVFRAQGTGCNEGLALNLLCQFYLQVAMATCAGKRNNGIGPGRKLLSSSVWVAVLEDSDF